MTLSNGPPAWASLAIWDSAYTWFSWARSRIRIVRGLVHLQEHLHARRQNLLRLLDHRDFLRRALLTLGPLRGLRRAALLEVRQVGRVRLQARLRLRELLRSHVLRLLSARTLVGGLTHALVHQQQVQVDLLLHHLLWLRLDHPLLH